MYKPDTRKYLGTLTLAAAVLLLASCGDTFRPIVTPTTGTPPSASTAITAVVVNQSPLGITCADGSAAPCAGSTTQLDVVAGVNMGNRVVGRTPTHATLPVSIPQAVYTSDMDSNTVTVQQLANVNPITLTVPAGAQGEAPQPVFVAANSTNVYSANKGSNMVTVFDSTNTVVVKSVAVGTAPVAMATTKNTSPLKVYVANNGSATDVGSVSVIGGADFTVLKTINLGGSTDATRSHPVWVTAGASDAQVYVVNSGNATNGTVSVVDTATDTVMSTIPVGANPVMAIFEPKLLRLYVVNKGSSSISVIDVANPASIPTPVTIAVGTNPVAVTALGDGSRVYVANSGVPGSDPGSVMYIDAGNLPAGAHTVTAYRGTNPSWIAASADSTAVVVANQFKTTTAPTMPPGSTIIRAKDNTIRAEIPAPFVNMASCTVDSDTCPRQQPVFVLVQ